jgi:quercetin dioxygenase-like cupin family protein
MNGRFGDEAGERKFRIFRAEDGRPCDLMTDATERAGEAPVAESRMDAPGLDFGSDLQVLFDMPGLSLVRVWFKSGYPLPRHTHDADCLYYITGGSLRMGHEVLRAGDGFFIPADVPYTYTVGEEGVELLEIRPSNAFDIKVKGNMAALQEKFMQTVVSRQQDWAQETEAPGGR